MENSIKILSTRPLPADLVEKAAGKGIVIDCISFIETEPIRSVQVQQEIEQALLQSTTVIFTSMNAVEAVASEMNELLPVWNIYCMGNTTRELCEKYFKGSEIIDTANSAAELAETIVANEQAEDVIFFCGDQRRNDLPEILSKNDIEVQEIVVYETIPVSKKIEEHYHGIMFFSPSAVNSFFLNNKLPSSTILFAIGNTTAEELKKHSTNTIITSDDPGKVNLAEKVIEYFSLD